MIRFNFIACAIASALFMNGCSKVLEPVSFFVAQDNIATVSEQEEFDINIKSLTFDTARKANKAPYPRRLILTGNGPKANVFDEAIFLKSNFPKALNNPDYQLGIGDEISFIQMYQFETKTTKWPNTFEESEYLLGPGDTLSLMQSNDSIPNVSFSYGADGKIITKQNTDKLISTEGVIGSNGNILLYGVGNILAAKRTLDNVRTEIRNILIRNGLAPNFQLEISNFNSQKAFVIDTKGESTIIPLNNIPITIKEVALRLGISASNENFATIELTRDNQEFRFTASQLFESTAPEIFLQNKDQIKIQVASQYSKILKSLVGSKGNIILEGVGTIPAMNRTLDDIDEDIRNILINKGVKPSYQLELIKFVSRKAYLIQKNVGSSVIPLTNTRINLRELILKSNNSKVSAPGLSVITLKRNGNVYRMTLDRILDPKTKDIWIMDEDQIEIDILAYKPGQVFTLSGAGKAQVIPINPSLRETLADILFAEGGALNNLRARRSEVYLLRGKDPSAAYHLDAQNVSRILVAAKTELRPNDIVYVADRPIISFSRTLSEISPLRILLRDIQNDNIP